MSAVNQFQPLAYPVKDAARVTGLSARKLEDFIARGLLAVQWADGKRLIDADELRAFVKALPYAKPEGSSS